MTKRKQTSNNDARVAAIVTGLFAAAVILFFIFSKSSQHIRPHRAAATEAGDMYLPNENAKPTEKARVPVPHPVVVPGSGGKIAFILDDWGQSMVNCRYLEEIPEPLAVSILPGLRHSKDVASCAARGHKVAMLHLPMEAMQNFDSYYPPNYLIKTTMSPALVTRILDADLAQLPSVEGVNNHMGSKATADGPLMRIILRTLRARGLFFVDSMTSSHSVAAAVAQEMGVRFARRNVFLDNVNTRPAIVKQIVILARIARRRGYAVAIGHDRHLTMQVLKDEIPWLESQGFQIVSIKDLLQKR
ncbi:MAG: divergent polysaccharide deacetylase family protein [Candidatus Omnitrophica bacterium]|nr:divergent polysaccharide deacetylase family protein [Candidatus Omnitrophota bacterium]MDE2223036.1 divergent polysaccharide deacetylase family protein [Candidatus Omnitrophota bacterium]